MSRLFLLGCVVLLASCRMKEPQDGVIRLTVEHGSYQPPCVRVELEDGEHRAATDIPSSQFTDPDTKETRVAMVRKPDWGQALSLMVSSFDAVTGEQCSGERVETQHDSVLNVPKGASHSWTITLLASDADGDGYLQNAQRSNGPDCDDTNPNIHPGATETCSATVDLNCNALIGCQEPACRSMACDDGNACTQGDHCEGEGAEARCLPTTTTQCAQPSEPCAALQTCQSATGLCEAGPFPEGVLCDDGNLCTDGDRCSAGTCAGNARLCDPGTASCRESAGTCNPTTGACGYKPLPATIACDDALPCTTADQCNGNGACVGTPAACAPPEQCFRLAQACTSVADCRYEVDPTKLNTPCTNTPNGSPGVCMPSGACSPFPYKPYNFDPNAIAASDIQGLQTSGAVTFDSDTLSWTPSSSVTNVAQLKYLPVTQGAGLPEAILIPVATLQLGGALTLVGLKPVILAVFGNASVDQPIFVNSLTAPGAGANQNCGSAAGTNGQFANRKAGGGGGAGNGTAGKEGGKGYSNGGAQGGAGAARSEAPVPLMGGCAGGDGGGGNGAVAGKGGAGGGAFQLSVARTLTVSKHISASGHGGGGGGANTSGGGASAGGGGGGSGGRVVLEAFQVALTDSARLTANGGGGGEGGAASSSASTNGEDGTNGAEDQSSPAAGGDSNSNSGGNGGTGGTGNTPPQSGSSGGTFNNAEGAGGGGGGAVGYIHLRSVQSCMMASGPVISPPPTGGCSVP
ncbi:putative metal-binding motif-containing protein [Corallococcus sp. BB11-1]|uniref:putative metal-binding motif-containing protein n=1 Tax=Corallococcus sp. BB11-1 TaxID=2996783 RepID=UPI00226E5D56|nr:putative metal-binding motif-containing protein [Corallococcus sp. BB11-1]MCY1033826.1 putative metal-binding motif-containing protein [Corallococcus sp. BB11-1]